MELLESMIRLSTPLLLAAMGGLLCERAGIATICLEGVMLVSAWCAASVAYLTQDTSLAVLAGVAGGVLTMGLHAGIVILSRADQIVSGVAVNLFAAGVTPVLTKALFSGPTNTPPLSLSERLGGVAIPALASIPVVGNLLFNHPFLIYVAFLLPLVLHYFLFRTGSGTRILASGDGPLALETAGVNVGRLRAVVLLVGGAIVSLGGIYMSIAHASHFTRDMTAGRGYIALTAVIFGSWRPLPTMVACLLFGLGDALQIRLQSAELYGLSVRVQFIQMLPYLLALLALAGFMGRARAPLSIGQRHAAFQ